MQLVPSHELIDLNPADPVNLHHPNDIECSVPTTDNNTDISDVNTTAPDRNIDDFDEFVSIETPNDNTNNSVTVNHTNHNDSVLVRHIVKMSKLYYQSKIRLSNTAMDKIHGRLSPS